MTTPTDRPNNSDTEGIEGTDGDTASPASAPGASAAGGAETPAVPPVARPGETGYLEPPENIVAGAKLAPNHWLSMVDPNWVGDEGEEPPAWARIGRWRTDDEGEIVEWEANGEYRPSPDSLQWPPPASPLDSALQLTATGYMEEEVFHLVLADAEQLAVCVEEDGSLKRTDVPDGPSTVPLFPPAPDLDPDDTPPHTLMTVLDLLDLMGESDDRQLLVLSSSAPVGQIVQPSLLRAAYTDLQQWKQENPEDFAELYAVGGTAWSDVPDAEGAPLAGAVLEDALPGAFVSSLTASSEPRVANPYSEESLPRPAGGDSGKGGGKRRTVEDVELPTEAPGSSEAAEAAAS